MNYKIETIAEYLARGGKITICPTVKPKEGEKICRKSPGGPATILNFDEADLFYGESRTKKTTTKPKSKLRIDLSLLPESLRTKYLARANEAKE